MIPSLAAKAGVAPSSVALNQLYYGDNLDVLRRHIASESVDLVYLDPPFNSNRSYNVLFKGKTGEESPAQIEAFSDTWTWSHETEALYPVTNRTYPKAQILTVADLLDGKRLDMPTSLLPYFQAQRRFNIPEQRSLGF
jgi:adenine specific DNA methylase Mod